VFCSFCCIEKPSAEFSARGMRWTRFRKICKPCYSVKYKEYNSKHRAKDPIWAQERDWRGHIKRTFGLSFEEYCDMQDKQMGVCAICGECPDVHLAVDHCHVTGDVRGLLCRRCNTGIGVFGDSIELLEEAIDYLHRTREFAAERISKDGKVRAS
jgi:hypothetical protein